MPGSPNRYHPITGSPEPALDHRVLLLALLWIIASQCQGYRISLFDIRPRTTLHGIELLVQAVILRCHRYLLGEC